MALPEPAPQGMIDPEKLSAVFREIQNDMMQLSTWGTVAAGCFLLFSALWGPQPLANFFAGLVMVFVAWAVHLLNRVNFVSASLLLILTHFAFVMTVASLRILPDSLFLLILPVGMAVVALGTWGGVITALASSLLLFFSPSFLPLLEPGVRATILAGIWITFWLVWLTLRPLVTAVRWSWSSQQQNMRALAQAREYQSQLRQSLQDLTSANVQLNRMNKLAQSLRQEAEEERQVKEEFVANVSHELRTPINMIIGFCSLILDSPDAYGDRIPSKLLADLQVVLRNSQHLSSLIDDVLDLSQINAGRMALTKERANVREIVDSAVTAVQPLFQSKQLSLEVHVEVDIPTIWCDRTRIREVLLNLLSNAGRFTEQGGVIVQAAVDGRYLKVSVTDTGPGISEDDQARLFKPFQQADNSTRRRYGGTGLGLNISKKFVELHDGRMWIESTVGEGSTFYFQIPIDPIAEPAASPARWISPYPAHHEHQPRLRLDLPETKPALLVVERGAALKKLLQRYFTRAEILTTDQFEEGLEQASQNRAQILLINEPDINMTLERIKTSNRFPENIPTMICHVPGIEQMSEELGVKDYLVKPISREALVHAIDQIDQPIKTILIIDDEPDARQLFRRILLTTGHGYTILRAANGQEGLEMMHSHPVDLVLLDLTMPQMDGFQFLRIKNEDSQIQPIPVILISARDPQGQPIVSNALTITSGRGLSVQQTLSCIEAVSAILMPMKLSDVAAPPVNPAG